MKSNIFLPLLFLIFGTFSLSAQELYYPLGENVNIEINKVANTINTSVNTGFKPLLRSELNQLSNFDSVVYQQSREEVFFAQRNKNWFYRKAFFEDFIAVNTENFTLGINPLLNLELGNMSDSSKIFMKNTRGIEFKGTIGKKVAFYSAFRENQAYYTPYISDFANRRFVSPGQGAHKIFGEDKKGYDFSMASGYVSYSPKNWINLQFGHDKNFIGEGHRSLLLSDNAYNYPFAKATLVYKGFKYVNMLTQFEDFDTKYYFYHKKKHGAFHYLSYNFKNRIEIGLFEGAIFQTTDTAARTVNKFPAEFFIPVIGTHTALNGFSGETNVLMGLNLKVKATDFIQTYGQLAIDDIENNKIAWQAGVKVFDVLHGKLKKNSLYFQAEYNSAASGTYGQKNHLQNWAHYNQELAHPLGTSFNELIVKLNYRFHNFYINAKYSQADVNKGDTFSDIFYNIPNTFDYVMPELTTIVHQTVEAGWIINPKTYLQVFGGIDRRTVSGTNSDFIFVGLKTDLNNFYYDF